MCGICGFTQATESSLPTLKAMCDVMAHRGPDGEGQYIDAESGIALGHRRLSLIDLANGNQPMVRATGEHAAAITSPALHLDGTPCGTLEQAAAKGQFAIVFNGEIYNYRDLRAELDAAGWAFQTNSDTEVLLTGYLAWGEGVLDRLRGMFAFAIWNRETRELFCARDVFGIKPFYYTQQNGQFIFASEIKCILEHPAYTRELNREALEQYLCFQFSALPETFFKGVFKLAPAHCMTVHADGTITTHRYWRPEYHFDNQRSRQDTVEAIDEAMRDSVRYHNVADVEVGSFLSSGIDSSYMAACLAKENPDIKTFTVGFECYKDAAANNVEGAGGKTMRDEISWARELADDLHIANTSKYIGEAEYWESLPRVQWHMDEPSADPSAVALYFVDQIAATQVKAVLSGKAPTSSSAATAFTKRRSPTPSCRGHRRGCCAGLRAPCASWASAVRTTLSAPAKLLKDWYYTNANGVAFTVEERAHLLKGDCNAVTPQQLTAPVYAEVKDLDETTRMQYVDLYFWLVGDILLKTDKMSMAHSLESRVPFLDRRVFDVSATIPTPLKANESQTKLTLREASERAIPKDWAQKEKLGFPVPVVNWLREDRYYNQVKEWFTGDIAREFFNTDELVRLLDEHKAGADRSRKIWIVYMFLMWYKIYFVDKTVPEKPKAR